MKIGNSHMRSFGVSGFRGFGTLLGLLFLIQIGFGIAVDSDPSFCCEKNNDGAWCVNDVESACDSDYLSAPTSCDSTSYCKIGTCYDSVEGLCMGNTPEVVCNENGGTWDARDIAEVPQCQLGCCVIADQAAFVSLVRCKRMSSLFGIENDYRTDITNEISCIAEAQSQDFGACVYEESSDRLCDFTTRGECGAGLDVDTVDETDVSLSSAKTFYEGFLCSAEELATSCARQAGTTCYEGDVYFVDSCGNKENVYSDNNDASWNNGKVTEAGEVCDANDGSDKNCGNCDYLLGSRCAEYNGILSSASGEDHYCQTTECVDRDGEARMNGEAWCVYDDGAGNGGDSVGSRYFREVCVDGDVRVEACADFRNEVCLEGSIETSDGEFGTAGCRVNRWQDCVLQSEEGNCLNIDRRDCLWVGKVMGMILGSGTSGEGSSTSYSNSASDSQAFNNPTATGSVIAPITGQAVFDNNDEIDGTVLSGLPGVCVPNFPPGLEFWEDNSAREICGQANARCNVVYEEGLIGGGSDIVSGAECLEEDWVIAANGICASLGDCGGAVNYNGDYSDDGYKWVVEGEERFLAPSVAGVMTGGFTGRVVGIVGGWFE